MTTPEAKRPYKERKEPTQNPTSLPIRFGYTGNYSNAILFDDAVLRKLANIMGTPKTTLVIKDGKERIERTGIKIVNFTGPHMDGTIESYNFKNQARIIFPKKRHENKPTVIEINSQVIDGYIREFYDTKTIKDYEMHFLQAMEEIILKGIYAWAFHEAKEKGPKNLFKNMRKKKDLEKFFLEYQSHILIND